MSTRHAPAGSALHDNRYMSSPEIVAARGVSAIAVAARAALIDDNRTRELIWWVQAKSMEDGGLKRLAAELRAAFPERCRKPERQRWDMRDPREVLDEAIADLCVNPCHLTSDDGEAREVERRRVVEAMPEIEDGWRSSAAPMFKNLLASLDELKSREEKRVLQDFVLTENCRPLWDCLEYSARNNVITLVSGREGRGKSETTKAYCACHKGTARYVSLKGVFNKTSAFREIGRAIGVGASLQRTATDMQTRIEEVLARSKLMLCIDESHFIFHQGLRIRTRPELVDWIGTLANDGVPICLVATPQFLICMQRVADQVGWNYLQFRRRVKRYKTLGDTCEADLKRVAARILPGAEGATIKYAAGYALRSKRDLSGLADVALEAKEIAGDKPIRFEHVQRAVEVLGESDAAFSKDLAEASATTGRKRRGPPAPVSLPIEDDVFRQEAPALSGARELQFGRELTPRESGERAASM